MPCLGVGVCITLAPASTRRNVCTLNRVYLWSSCIEVNTSRSIKSPISLSTCICALKNVNCHSKQKTNPYEICTLTSSSLAYPYSPFSLSLTFLLCRALTSHTAKRSQTKQNMFRFCKTNLWWSILIQVREAFVFGSRQLKVAEMGGRAPKTSVNPRGSAPLSAWRPKGSCAHTVKKTRFQIAGGTFDYGESESRVGSVRNRCICSRTAKTWFWWRTWFAS